MTIIIIVSIIITIIINISVSRAPPPAQLGGKPDPQAPGRSCVQDGSGRNASGAVGGNTNEYPRLQWASLPPLHGTRGAALVAQPQAAVRVICLALVWL